MWKCDVCRMRRVPDTGFKMYISYDLVSVPNQKPERYPIWCEMKRQIRICSICLKKKTVKIEMGLKAE